jgi:hypothetical protein
VVGLGLRWLGQPEGESSGSPVGVHQQLNRARVEEVRIRRNRADQLEREGIDVVVLDHLQLQLLGEGVIEKAPLPQWERNLARAPAIRLATLFTVAVADAKTRLVT